jgi:hypothetical protein
MVRASIADVTAANADAEAESKEEVKELPEPEAVSEG